MPSRTNSVVFAVNASEVEMDKSELAPSRSFIVNHLEHIEGSLASYRERYIPACAGRFARVSCREQGGTRSGSSLCDLSEVL
jgi:hypothetical protein